MKKYIILGLLLSSIALSCNANACLEKNKQVGQHGLAAVLYALGAMGSFTKAQQSNRPAIVHSSIAKNMRNMPTHRGWTFLGWGCMSAASVHCWYLHQLTKNDFLPR